MLRKSCWIAVLSVLAFVPPPAGAAAIKSLYCYLYAEASGREDTHDVVPDLELAVTAGETVEISLYGVVGEGENDIRLPVSFSIPEGDGRVEVVARDEDAITVKIASPGKLRFGYRIETAEHQLSAELREGSLLLRAE